MGYPRWTMLLLPWFRLELPAWGKLLSLGKVYSDEHWADGPVRVIRGKYHGYKMRLDLKDWAQRSTYFLGRYYDLPSQLFIRAALAEGDTLIDIGGNIGMMTLVGARCVGYRGRVITFEPNPEAAGQLRYALESNGIENVELHQIGLSDMPGELTLSVLTTHSGLGTFAPVREEEARHVTARHVVPVLRGDDVIPDTLSGNVIVKIDVEGFECSVIRGLAGTLRKHRPAVITEIVEAHLARAGATPAEVFALMHGHGYQGYVLDIEPNFLHFGYHLMLEPVAGPIPGREMDVVWLLPGGPHEKHLQSRIRRKH
jgi:FkbM family methyltransferase